MAYIVIAHMVIAHVVEAYIVMAYIVMAYIVMADIVTVHIVIKGILVASIVMTYVVRASLVMIYVVVASMAGCRSALGRVDRRCLARASATWQTDIGAHAAELRRSIRLRPRRPARPQGRETWHRRHGRRRGGAAR